MANIAQGEAECYICHMTLIRSCIFYTKQSGSALIKCFIVRILYLHTNLIKNVSSLFILINGFALIKCVNGQPFYNYSSVL